MAVPLVVLLPLIALTPSADHRFNVYANGALYATHPGRILRAAVTSVPIFRDLGNFRPVGRLVEWSLDAVAFALTELLGLPANITLRLVSFAAAIVLTLAVVVFAESISARGRLFLGRPSVLVAVLPFAVGAGLVAAGRTSTTVLFGGLYFLTSALVLAVASWASRVTRMSGGMAVLAVLTGALLAAFNELAYLAVPVATVAVVLRGRVVLDLSWSATVRGAGSRFVGLLWLGFLPVFLPIRVLIYRACAHGGCYRGSDIHLPGAAAALPNRLVSWLPPLMWNRGTDSRPSTAILLLAALTLTILAVRAGRQLGELTRLDRRQACALAVIAVVVLLLAGALAALNSDVQGFAAQGRWGQGWRDSALTTAAGSVLLLTPVALGHRRLVSSALAVLVVAGAVSAGVNQRYHDASSAGRYPYLHDRIAQEIADFDRTPAGDQRRCGLRAQFVQTSIVDHHGVGYQPEIRRFDLSLDRATRQLAGRRFCSEAPQ